MFEELEHIPFEELEERRVYQATFKPMVLLDSDGYTTDEIRVILVEVFLTCDTLIEVIPLDGHFVGSTQRLCPLDYGIDYSLRYI